MNGALDLITNQYNDFCGNYSFLLKNTQISFANEYKSQFSKVMLLSVASYFESAIIKTIKEALNPSDCTLTDEFISKKALARQYHTLFDWDKRNANKFFAFFGDDFKQFMINKINQDRELESAISSFITIGSLRNQLAHQNYASFNLQLTAEEIHNKFQEANNFFVSRIKDFIVEFRTEQLTAKSE